MFAARVLRQRSIAAPIPPQQSIPRKQGFRFSQGQSRARSGRDPPKPGPRWRTFEDSQSSAGKGQGTGPGGHRPQYSRFSRFNDLRTLWLTSQAFRYGTGLAVVGGGGFYVFNLETVAVSGRRRFNIYSPEAERNDAKGFYEHTLHEFEGQMLPPWHPSSKLVQKVLDRLIPHSGLHNLDWQIHVIDDPNEKNAFVIPGGKVFVFSGLLPICDGEDGLAAVLGHEIAHNAAHHTAERMSSMFLASIGVWGVSLLLNLDPYWADAVFKFGYTMPGSRKMESEADYLGLLIMAESCYNPDGALQFWRRMEKAGGADPPQLLSTHPSDRSRIGKIEAWLPEARTKREMSDCGGMLGYGSYQSSVNGFTFLTLLLVNDFREVTQGSGAWRDVW
ncbi:MAG: hypothetical protein M1835_002911 [Candelina submexicana]|nr:MAG: hypothetical protein M1835_002911 [Candelina submexicana]